MQYKNQIRGTQNKLVGKTFEQMIISACEFYSERGIAEIEKTPEPMKPIRSLRNGQFVSCFEKKAQPDFKGTLKGGRSIVFEAKHTSSEKMLQSVVTPEQKERLDKHRKAGAACYVVISFNFKKFFCIPWEVFDDMKNIFGRKYITAADDLSQYEIKITQGILCFLGYPK